MYAIVTNTATSKNYKLKLRTIAPASIRTIGQKIALSSFNYKIMVVAETEDDIDFINNNFYNFPVPIASKKVFWTGDNALFLILNFPVG